MASRIALTRPLWLNKGMKWTRLLPLVAVSLVPALLAFATTTSTPSQTKGSISSSAIPPFSPVEPGPTLTSKDQQSIEAIAQTLFTGLIKGEYEATLERLSPVYGLDVAKRSYLAERMLQLEQRVGRAQAYERLGRRFLSGSGRVVRVYFLSLHPRKPAVWTLDFYLAPGVTIPATAAALAKPAAANSGAKGNAEAIGKAADPTAATTGGTPERWILTSLRFDTEAAFALIEGSEMWHKVY